jgi:ethanolaminephosphotransferase
VPKELLIFMGLFYFLYRMLDEMDGKQARRTGNSSALGLIFDHGCDAFSIGLVPLTCSKLFHTGDNIWALAAIAASCASFHFTTLEEYYTGGLFLEIGNAITDGSGPFIATMVYIGIKSPKQLEEVVFEYAALYKESPMMTLMDMMLLVGVLINVVTILMW